MKKKLLTFKDLEFKLVYEARGYTNNTTREEIEERYGKDGVMASISFKNGFGVSVVKHKFSYGYNKGLYELAVIQMIDEDNFELCYDTSITSDVEVGNKEQITEIMAKVQRLHKRKAVVNE